jgi:hypothetical protein
MASSCVRSIRFREIRQTGVALLAWMYLFLASFAIDHFELFGLRQVWSFFASRAFIHN